MIQKLAGVRPYSACAAGAPVVIGLPEERPDRAGLGCKSICLSPIEHIWVETDAQGLGGVWLLQFASEPMIHPTWLCMSLRTMWSGMFSRCDYPACRRSERPGMPTRIQGAVLKKSMQKKHFSEIKKACKIFRYYKSFLAWRHIWDKNRDFEMNPILV